MFVQLAKEVYGASLVVTTASAGKVDLLKSLGVDKVVDYKKEKYEELPDKYDVVFDTVGKLLSLSQISSLYVCNCTETKPQKQMHMYSRCCRSCHKLQPVFSHPRNSSKILSKDSIFKISYPCHSFCCKSKSQRSSANDLL